MPLASRPTIPPTEPVLVLGETTFRDYRTRFGLLPEDRLRHLWMIGKTGSGKSTLIANLIRQDLETGEGFALIDPHGDLVDTVLPFVPKERTNQVLLFAPDDKEFPISFNVFRQGRKPHPDPALLASQLVSVFRKFWADSWGPRLEHVLRNAILAVTPDTRASLLFLYRFLVDEALREKVVSNLKDPVVRQFWTKEFPSYPKSLQGEALSPVLNKLGAFVTNPIVRNIVSQERSRIDLVEFMRQRGILLARLPTGTIGEDASHLLGGLLLSAVQLAGMERPRGSPVFTIYVDEFQHFVNDSLTTLLSEARKFGMAIVLAHQYLGQLTEPVRDAVIGNVGTAVLFRVGGQDAEALESEFGPDFTAYDLQHLERFHFAVRLLVRGDAEHPFSARTLPARAPPPLTEEFLLRVRSQSRARYAASRQEVEVAIVRSMLRDPP
jgi:hypothetical protein